MKVTLAKALKLKNRFASKLGEVSRDVLAHNSVVDGQDRPVDVNVLIDKRSRLAEGLISLKTAINMANQPVQSTIYLLAELKGELVFLREIDTTSGKQIKAATWGENEKVYEAEEYYTGRLDWFNLSINDQPDQVQELLGFHQKCIEQISSITLPVESCVSVRLPKKRVATYSLSS